MDTSSFKIVYVAPMKALVAEMVGNFSQRLKKFGMQVSVLVLLKPTSAGCLAFLRKTAESSGLQATLAMCMSCRSAMLKLL